MSGLDEYTEKELEIDFYGFTVQEVVTEVKCCLEDIVNEALEDSEKKLLSKVGTKCKDEFKTVKKNYMEAIENHKARMQALIKDDFRLPANVTGAIINEVDANESNVEKHVKDLQMKSAALDIYMKKLLMAQSELQAYLNIDISELKEKFNELDICISQLSDNLNLGNKIFSQDGQVYHLEQSIRSMTID